ncbi:Putative TolA protein [hydrothermal vent metagenome]|uniref:TolA protein n=1 Tax=hydrothermal vent metagenome TaxID=652676 RepID=A0A3B1ANT1_9ZZZZ
MVLINAYPHTPLLPWTETRHDRRFRQILIICLLLSAVLGSMVSYLPKPEIQQQELKQISPRLAKLILQKKQEPKPKPVIPEIKKVEKKKTVEKKKPKQKKKKIEKKKAVDKTAKARKKAQNSGLLAMQDELADLRDSFDIAAMQGLTPQQNKGKTRSQPQAAAVLSVAAGKGSSGINTRNLSRSTGGQALVSRSSSKVESKLEKSVQTPKARAGYKSARSQEEIELVFQKNKGAIYSLYNRALRRDPTLQGKVLLELTIAPGGEVTRARILSSDLNSPKLEKRLLSRIRLFRFAARDVDTVTLTYPIDFLPS